MDLWIKKFNASKPMDQYGSLEKKFNANQPVEVRQRYLRNPHNRTSLTTTLTSSNNK